MENTHERRQKLIGQFVGSMDQWTAIRRSKSPRTWTDLQLTMPQLRTLMFLSQGSKRMSEISTYLDRGMPSATSMIDRLVSKSFVERVEDPNDRRVVACQLTTSGRDMVEQFNRMDHMRSEAIANGLTVDELEIVAPAMEVLVRAIARMRRQDQAQQPVEDQPEQQPIILDDQGIRERIAVEAAGS
ncbi:MAG: MarR family transcriptional regulator [SAR202 cluster bacterium]|nr:MarR family transcriptional regulator [SAR202 cluster bacterium]